MAWQAREPRAPSQQCDGVTPAQRLIAAPMERTD